MSASRPPATRREPLVERVAGHEVADPYRWLEDPDTDEVRAWAQAQNAHARAHLDALPARAALRDRLAALWHHERRGVPWRRGGWWLQQRHDGLADQPVLCAAASDGPRLPPDDSWWVLLDPNRWPGGGTRALMATASSDDGRLLAYATSDAGSDWMTWRVREVPTGRDLHDEVPWARFAGAAWLPDGSGFVYGGFDPPPAGRAHQAAVRDHRLRLHRLGAAAEADRLVHARPDQPEWGFSPDITHDGRWLVVHVTHGTDRRNRVHLARVDGGEVGEVTPWLDDFDASYEVLGALDGELVVHTDLDAPRGRVLAIDPADPAVRREVVAEDDARLLDAALVGGHEADDDAWLVCHHLTDATSRVVVHEARGGAPRHTVDVGLGTVQPLVGERRGAALHLATEDFASPTRVVRHDPATGDTSEVFAPRTPRPPAEIVTEQVFVHHAGAAVPLFLVHRADAEPTGDVPTVLWGYGGFDIPVTPMFRAAWRAWVDAGGLLAVACLRGGGEYGRAWHDDGRLRRKQHTFDDALACAAWLTGRRRGEVDAEADGGHLEVVWSAPARLGIEGRSNGGALVGAAITQQPGAFGSAVPEVGVLDLVRFHRWTIGWAWTSDYGDPDDPDDIAALLRWSPYHNVREGAGYPPTLLTTADTDDRVVPAHSYKMAAALQHAGGGTGAPALLRVDLDAGHGAGKPISKLLDERADVLAFHAHHLGLEVGG